MTPRVLIHVQHLLGTGHLKRAAAIARALAATGCAVDLVSGGMPLRDLDPGDARLVQLPPLRAADASFKALVDERGASIDDTWKNARRERLLQIFAAARPDVLITELFPFGRRLLEFELLPLLEVARACEPRPLILCSLRDILVAPSDAAKAARAVERARTLYDDILVHGDPELIDLPASYPAAREIANRLHYTGYIVDAAGPEAPRGDGADEVVVSSGGGAVGARLLECAAAAQAHATDGRRWRLLLGPDIPADARGRLREAAGPRLIVEPARRDFASLLRRCHVSVSQAGYNTSMDILGARAAAVLVPFAGDGETEQARRAAALAARGWAEMLAEDALDPQTLAAAVRRAGQRGRPDAGGLRMTGAQDSAALIQRLLAQRVPA